MFVNFCHDGVLSPIFSQVSASPSPSAFPLLMANYVYREGAVTPIQDIIDHAKQSKESTISGSYLSNTSLGLLVHDVWLGSIQKVRRGPRKQQQNVYLNLTRINSAPKQHQDYCISLSDELAVISIPSDWKMVTDKTDFV